MRVLNATLLAVLVLASGSGMIGCAAPTEDAASSEDNLDLSPAKISFKADFSEVVQGRLTRGAKVAIDFDARRVPCSAGNDQQNYRVIAHYRFNGGPIKSVRVAGSADGRPHGSISLAESGDLELWFENTSDSGCHAWDSNLGANYHFAVAAAPVNPDWAGEARFVTSRATCNGTYCDQDLKPITSTLTYDSWVRQRAAIRLVTFEAWKPGVTDRDASVASLDARVFVRNRVAGAFTALPAAFDRRAGNNARFSVDLRAMDPLGDYVFPTTRAQCPAGIRKEVASGNTLAVVDVQFYMKVGSREVRPSDGTVFHARFEQDAGRFAVCFTP